MSKSVPTQNSELETQNAKGWRPDQSSISRDIKGASPCLDTSFVIELTVRRDRRRVCDA